MPNQQTAECSLVREHRMRGRDFIHFRTTFFNSYDFEVLKEIAQTSEVVERTGSRSTTWKVLLGVLPAEASKEEWL